MLVYTTHYLNLVLSYCISVWGGASPTEIEKLFVTQKTSIRILFGKEPYWFVTDKCQRVITYDEQMTGTIQKSILSPYSTTKTSLQLEIFIIIIY